MPLTSTCRLPSWDVDVRVLPDLEEFCGRGVQRGIEMVGDLRQHGSGFVAVRQILIGDAAEILQFGEVGIRCGGVEQCVAAGPQKCVGGQPWKGRVGAGLPEVTQNFSHVIHRAT